MAADIRGPLMAVLGVAFIALSMWFLGGSLVAGVQEAGGLGNLLEFNIPLFVLSSVVLAGHLAMAGYTWDFVTRTAGGRLGFVRGFAIHFLSQVGKYVPGKVWAAMGKFSLSRNAGLTPAQTGQGLVLETVFIVIGCLLTTIPLMPVVAAEAGIGSLAGTVMAVAVALVLIASVHPFLFGRLARLAARVMKTRGELRECSYGEMLGLLPVYIGVFLLLGIAFWVLSLSFGLVMPFFPGILVYPAAMGIGYLAIFAPGGLGARELTTVWLIHLIVPGCDPGLAELTALVGRIWITIGELIAFGISFPMYGIRPSTFREAFSRGKLSN